MFNKIFLYVIAFITGVAGMAVEIVAVRLVSPFLGSATEVWSIIISIIMVALALGYFLGKYFRSEFLLITLAGIFIVFSYLSVSSLAVNLVHFSPILKTFLVSILLFFPPVFLLGSVYPIIVKDSSTIIYAISTIGSVLGTLLATFVLIPFYGAKISFLIIAIILEIISLIGFKKWKKLFPFIILCIIFIIFPRSLITNDNTIIYQKESVYQPIKVIKQSNSFFLSLDSFNLDHGFSSIYTPGKYLTNYYYDNFLLLPYFLQNISNLKVLIIGLGGGTISRQYDHYFYKNFLVKIDGVEIDSEVVEVGKKYFDLNQPSLTTYIQDGRIFLSENKKTYDLILIDVYSRQNYIPYHLATAEFLKLAKSRLNEGGLLAYNVSDSSKSLTRLSRINQTVYNVFPYTYSIYPNENTEYLVVGSNNKIDFGKDVSKEIIPELSGLYNNFTKFSIKQISNVDIKYILTDDNAPDRI